MRSGPFCHGTYRDGRPCRKYPGEGTLHPGVGYCSYHEPPGFAKEWEMASNLSRELDITPWEALLASVRLAAHRVAWVDTQLGEAVRINDGDVDNMTVRRWLAESRKERTLLARTSAAAINAGIQERFVDSIEDQGKLLAEGLQRALDAVPGLSEDQRQAAITAAFSDVIGEIESGEDGS